MSHSGDEPIYGVSDLEAFRELVATAVERHGSALSAARTALGFDADWSKVAASTKSRRDARAFQRMLARWSKDGASEVRGSKRQLLDRLLTATERRTLEDLLLPHHVRVRLAHYQHWLRNQFDYEPTHGELINEENFDHLQAANLARESERGRLWTLIDRQEPDLAKRLVVAVNKARDRDRAQLATRAILDPLLQFGVSGRVERHWSELTPPQLRKYLKAAIQTQEVLLDRPPALVRTRRTPARALEGLPLPAELIQAHPDDREPSFAARFAEQLATRDDVVEAEHAIDLDALFALMNERRRRR